MKGGGRVTGQDARPPCGGCWRDTGAAGWSSLCYDFSGFLSTPRTLQRKKPRMSPNRLTADEMLSFASCNMERMIQREAEQMGKPTYHSYSSIPIEQASGPKAAQREAVRRDRDVRNRGVLGDRKAREQTGQETAQNHRSDDDCDLEEESSQIERSWKLCGLLSIICFKQPLLLHTH